MTFKRLDSYKGLLSAEKIAFGMNAAGRSAKRMHDDAKLLLANGRFPSAASLAILAIEEAGKISILRGMSTAPDDAALKAAWKDYRSHTAKNVAWIITELAAKGAWSLCDLRPIYDSDSDHPALLDAIKQIGFYTDCLGKAHWSEPPEVIDERLASMLVTVAGILVPKREIGIREIELWIQHVGPHAKSPGMAHAAVRFYEAMRNEGLDTNDPDEIRKFFGLKFAG
ncbi:AbiV family abortive infection protein [Oryzifoliimicrobium ureilyticus]|uniref:AbiV family abortive infection protein n=1 Tax=Oryzifoliimicrobium ureilyticus TaxID=3113724 RepID=UPI00307657DD